MDKLQFDDWTFEIDYGDGDFRLVAYNSITNKEVFGNWTDDPYLELMIDASLLIPGAHGWVSAKESDEGIVYHAVYSEISKITRRSRG